MDVAEMRAPGPEHAFLAEQAGEWEVTVEFWPDPAGEPLVSRCRAERTMILGGRVLEEKLVGELMEMPYESIGQLGYDRVLGRHWTTSADNMGTGVFYMTGAIDAAAGTGTFEGMASSPEMGGEVPIRHEIRVGEATQTIELFTPGPDGAGIRLMRFEYERR